MDSVFVVEDKSNRDIRLTKKQWAHIITKHPFMASRLNEVRETIENPDRIVPHEFGRLFDYYKHYKYPAGKLKFLKVVVKYLNGEGFILSAYFVKRIN